ncbi:DnaD domain protein [Mycoplasma phocimorsus]|uniref:DnaD domain protein n=1 Tax=Mycoplasma phocimorsus TaxID=3045839 RepID=A0AAJ1UZB8_9MOLU|nr:DnaD domain protein [Mycoplasma phocimorsus]MDJ1645568.1 DnaD domain protein [Mycoplasma phocimorsus]MDJ1646704.1 DnaD domain protein [Mycoplasma phocimorsus]MDJ1648852.1 DnaD domain protein [Mycoplasma phocimorsus]
MGTEIKIVSGYDQDYNFNLKHIEKLYKPILGDSFYLYKYLTNGIKLNYFNIEEIFGFLNINQTQFDEQRKLLEAVNLIETHLNKENNQLIFIINIPLNNERFFKNKLLMNVLLKKTSAEYVQKIKEEFLNNKTADISAKFSEITVSFDDIFGNLLLNNQNQKEVIKTDASINLRNRIIPLNNTKFTNIQSKITDPRLVDNLYYKILNDDAISFYSYLIKSAGNIVYNEAVQKRITNLVVYLNKIGLENKVINLLFNYAFSSNKKIYDVYIKKIANNLVEKNIIDFESVEEHLKDAFKSKHRSEYGFEQETSKAQYIQITSNITNKDIKIAEMPIPKKQQVKKQENKLYNF